MTDAAIDLRETRGRWTPAQRVKNDAIHALVRAALGVARAMPERALLTMGRFLGSAAFHLLPIARRTALANAARALPDRDAGARRAIVRTAYASLGGWLGEAVASLREDAEVALLPFPEASQKTLRDALDEGRGVVFVSAHLGPWERVAATLVASGFPLVTVARESYDPRLTSLYDRLRGARGVRAIYRGAPGSGFAMLRTLRAGGLLGAPMDLRSRVPSIDAPFFGVPAPTPVGPAKLALRTGAAVVVGTAAPPLDAPTLTTTRIETTGLTEEALTAALNEELCRRIVSLPEAWVWMHPRFVR